MSEIPLKSHQIPYSSGSSVKDVIVDFTFITSAGVYLERVIRQVTNLDFLRVKNPSTLLSNMSVSLASYL